MGRRFQKIKKKNSPWTRFKVPPPPPPPPSTFGVEIGGPPSPQLATYPQTFSPPCRFLAEVFPGPDQGQVPKLSTKRSRGPSFLSVQASPPFGFFKNHGVRSKGSSTAHGTPLGLKTIWCPSSQTKPKPIPRPTPPQVTNVRFFLKWGFLKTRRTGPSSPPPRNNFSNSQTKQKDHLVPPVKQKGSRFGPNHGEVPKVIVQPPLGPAFFL